MRPHNIHTGDTVLLLQKQSKSNPCHDPTPYEVISVEGTQITAKQGEKVRKPPAPPQDEPRKQPPPPPMR